MVTVNGEEMTREAALALIQEERDLAEAVDRVLMHGDFGQESRPSVAKVRAIVDEGVAEFEKDLAETAQEDY